MEVLASVVSSLDFIALRLIVELIVSSDGEEPEHKDVANDEDGPVHDELCLLLRGDLGLALVEAGRSVFVLCHLLKEVLSSISLHVQI